MRKTLTFSLLGVLLVTFWAFAQNQPAKTLALRGGLLIDGTGRPPVANSVVLISNGKFQAAGAEGSVTVPAGATVIDASGKTIMPGLVDSHVHIRNYLAPMYLYWGITAMGDLGNSTGWTLAYRDAIAKGRMAGPYLMVAGAKFDPPLKPGDPLVTGELRGFETFLLGNSAYVHVTDEASANEAIAKVKKQGVDAVKLYTRRRFPWGQSSNRQILNRQIRMDSRIPTMCRSASKPFIAFDLCFTNFTLMNAFPRKSGDGFWKHRCARLRIGIGTR
jgi:hypothetical protein